MSYGLVHLLYLNICKVFCLFKGNKKGIFFIFFKILYYFILKFLQILNKIFFFNNSEITLYRVNYLIIQKILFIKLIRNNQNITDFKNRMISALNYILIPYTK